MHESNTHDSGIKLMDLTLEENSLSTRDQFGDKFISAIQKIITNLISNPQIISSLLLLIPTFPPAAILGSFVMVILSILQNPTILKFLQSILPDMGSLADSLEGTFSPKKLVDFDNINTSGSNLVRKGAKYGIKLVDLASKQLNPEDLNTLEFDLLNNSPYSSKKKRSLGHEDQNRSAKKKKPSNQRGIDRKFNTDYLTNDDGSPIPLLDLRWICLVPKLS